MERVVYEQMAELDQRHWWYRARREVLAALIRRAAPPPPDARLLEIGCGTGHNLAMLAQFGAVDALELDDEARTIAEQRLGRPIMRAPLPELAGVPDGQYDLVGAFDVIEHIADDAGAIASIAAKLKPGGKLVMTVPAHAWMWSAHDVVNHHKRRYTRKTLRAVVAEAGLKLEMMSFFNSLLFPLAATARMAGKVRKKEDSDDKLPPRPLNALFEAIFGLERYAIGRLPFPPGVSLVAIVSAP